MKKQLQEKLDILRREIGQEIIVHIGMDKSGQYNILGIECCGPSQNRQKKKFENESSEPLEEQAELNSYIG